jgi:6-phosphogluconate dehydrogenase (decarboxylating)
MQWRRADQWCFTAPASHRGSTVTGSSSPYDIELRRLFEHGNHGTVIHSWLIELMGDARCNEVTWDTLSTEVEHTGEALPLLRREFGGHPVRRVD